MTEQLTFLKEQMLDWLIYFNIPRYWAVFIQSILAVIIILVIAWIFDRIITIIMRKLAPLIIGRTKNKWDDILLKNRVFSKVAHILPGLVVINLYQFIASKFIRHFIENIIESYFIIVFVLLINSLLSSVHDIYERAKGKSTNVTLYIQLLKVIVYSLGFLAIIAIFANKNFMEILRGLGAIITILLIVYKDTILGFIAGIQLSAYGMLKVGDWITIPKDNADGNVIEISLNTVKIQNWDKTITTVPTYQLISEPFTNWKGMEESGGRRIKRHINIDMDSISFLTDEDIEKYKKFKLLKPYLTSITEKIAQQNSNEDIVNQIRLTNIGTFRKYIENYLLEKEFVNKNMTFIVRQLQSTEKGVPLEIYVFSKVKQWNKYEEIQADIFDHIFAILPEFNLRIFQSPTARSLSEFIDKKA